MKVQLKLFAVAKQLAGRDTVEIDLPERPSVGQLRAALARQYPELTVVLAQTTFAVDQEYATDQTTLTSDSEVACIPPVSGG